MKRLLLSLNDAQFAKFEAEIALERQRRDNNGGEHKPAAAASATAKDGVQKTKKKKKGNNKDELNLVELLSNLQHARSKMELALATIASAAIMDDGDDGRDDDDEHEEKTDENHHHQPDETPSSSSPPALASLAASAGAATTVTASKKKKAPPSGSSSSKHFSTAAIASTTTAKPPPPPSPQKQVPTQKQKDDDYDDDNQEHWKTRYDELVQFKEQEGHLCPLNSNNSLYKWMFRQRQAWNEHILKGEEEGKGGGDAKKKMMMMAERLELLIQIGLGTRQGGPRSTEELHAAASALSRKKCRRQSLVETTSAADHASSGNLHTQQAATRRRSTGEINSSNNNIGHDAESKEEHCKPSSSSSSSAVGATTNNKELRKQRCVYPRDRPHFYNCVVKPVVDKHGGTSNQNKYFFVLHYNEDSQQLRLVPLEAKGTISLGKRRGRPRYRCVVAEGDTTPDEKMFLTASAKNYQVVSASETVRTFLVAQEAWDIEDDCDDSDEDDDSGDEHGEDEETRPTKNSRKGSSSSKQLTTMATTPTASVKEAPQPSRHMDLSKLQKQKIMFPSSIDRPNFFNRVVKKASAAAFPTTRTQYFFVLHYNEESGRIRLVPLHVAKGGNKAFLTGKHSGRPCYQCDTDTKNIMTVSIKDYHVVLSTEAVRTDIVAQLIWDINDDDEVEDGRHAVGGQKRPPNSQMNNPTTSGRGSGNINNNNNNNNGPDVRIGHSVESTAAARGKVQYVDRCNLRKQILHPPNSRRPPFYHRVVKPADGTKQYFFVLHCSQEVDDDDDDDDSEQQTILRLVPMQVTGTCLGARKGRPRYQCIIGDTDENFRTVSAKDYQVVPATETKRTFLVAREAWDIQDDDEDDEEERPTKKKRHSTG
jgi:Helicase associated domain